LEYSGQPGERNDALGVRKRLSVDPDAPESRLRSYSLLFQHLRDEPCSAGSKQVVAFWQTTMGHVCLPGFRAYRARREDTEKPVSLPIECFDDLRGIQTPSLCSSGITKTLVTVLA
jgi:hypothetical protein